MKSSWRKWFGAWGINIFTFLLMVLPALGAETRPWPPQYKIKADETNRLTAADVVGPDGLVYPDWRYAGMPGGIPTVKEAVRIEDFGAKPDDDQDDSAAVAKAIGAAARAGGGAVVFGRGTYHLDSPLLITNDNIVIRGQGMRETQVVFRYQPRELTFVRLQPGEVIGPDRYVEVHAPRDGLKDFRIESDGKVVYAVLTNSLVPGNFVLRAPGKAVVAALGRGKHTLKAIATWGKGDRQTANIEVNVDPDSRLPEGMHRFPDYHKSSVGAFVFVGDHLSGPVWKLAKDARRGETWVELDGPANLPAGASLVLFAPITERWNKLTHNVCKTTDLRRYEFQVVSSAGNRVQLNQPPRIDFPVVDGAIAQRVYPIRRCGVEGLTIKQPKSFWTELVLFYNAWECWARDVRVEKAGRFPVYVRNAKWCEIRDCEFDGIWFHGSGGTGYVGWERAYDCLMDRVQTWGLRHAPCLEWSAYGNVIRRSTFNGSDAQWHSGWVNENLFEQCVVDARGTNGSYGFGAYSTAAADLKHGPIGPRNVVYNCDFTSRKAGLILHGSNEGWLILHNRFVVESGAGIEASRQSFDHIFQGNTFVLKRRTSTAIRLLDADCVGIEATGNTVYGGTNRLAGGKGRLARDEANKLHPLAADVARPTPAVPSIFEWQKARR